MTITPSPANLPPVDPVLNKVVEMLKFSGITYALVAVQGNNIVLVKCGGYDEDSMYAAFRRYVRTNLTADSDPALQWFKVAKGIPARTTYAIVLEDAKPFLN
jgi:hypothetical protein